jgi:SRSO17 transposase
VPDQVEFATKPQIAITQLREARQSGAPNAVVLADAGYGNDAAFRASVGELGLQYAVGIQSSTRVWPPGLAPLPAVPSTGKAGRPRSLQRRVPGHDPVAVKGLALALDPSCYHTVSWREGTRAALSSRFAALRVRTSHRDNWRATPRDEEWLLIEWPIGEIEPTKYWLSTLPEETIVLHLVHVAKMRWRIERDYQDLKQEFGLGHFEGRGWRGFHHHASLCIAAYGFLVAQRLSQGGKKNSEIRSVPALPADYTPRGSSTHAATRI